MQKIALARSFALAGVLLAPMACSNDGDGGSITGTTVATRTVTVGTAPVAVDLPGKRSQGAKVDFPVGVTKTPMMVTVNLNEGVKKRGAEVSGPIEIVNLGLLFEPGAPAKMRQPLPPVPTGKKYVTVFAAKEGEAWTILPTPPRVVGAGLPVGEVDASTTGDPPGTADGGVAQLPRAQTAEPAPQFTTYEIDVTGTGYWGIGYEVAVVSTGGGAGCAGALSRLKGCGFTFQPAGTDPCAGTTNADNCEFGCLSKSSCPQLTALYCGGTPTATDAILQCVQACISAAQIPCGNGETYEESDKCDGFAVCANGADEAGCVQFACGDGSTVPESHKCDGFPDCDNSADEAGCPAPAQEPDLFCPDGTPAFGGDSGTQTDI